MSLAERMLEAVAGRLRHGRLEIETSDGRLRAFDGEADGPRARVRIAEPRAARSALLSGGVGLGEAYMRGEWDTPDLEAVLALALANVPEQRTPVWMRGPLSPLQRLAHLARPNSRPGARRNIEYHYDLGNDFYSLWLDEQLTYSSAMFEDEDESLETAQRRKWDRLLELVQPRAGQRLLEVGCGWGGFAMHAAERAGCRVAGITISPEQHGFAADKVRAHGLDDLVEIRMQDYRDVPGRFDAVASIEMFEAVGERYWPVFFRSLRDRLGSGGVAALQVITISEARFERYRRRADFTQRYIFPGGMLPSPTAFREAASAQGLTSGPTHSFGQSYAMTLERWRERFEDRLDDVRALGFDERFIRMWRFYLAYCRAGFRAGTIDVMQVPLSARR